VSETRHRGRWTSADRVEAEYRYLPFEVPPGTGAVAVQLAYDRTAAVLDLGVFDPERFRGWSGGARAGFVITTEAATPGYLPGSLPAGEWQVILGLYRIPDAGAEFTLDVRVEAERGKPGSTDLRPAPVPAPGPLPPRPPPRRLPALPGRRWLAGDLHAHTLHSDGTLTVDQLACLARARGLDVLFVTDHNTTSHHADLPAATARTGVLLLPGQEVTTSTGHANCFGGTGWIDFRQPADQWLAAAESRGGLLSVNHPVAGPWAWHQPLSRPTPLVEAWHGTWDGFDPLPLDWWRTAGGVPVGGSDWHRPGEITQLGHPTTWIEVELKVQLDPYGHVEDYELSDVISALAAGRVALSAAPAAPVILRHGDQVLVVDAAGTTLHALDRPPRRVAADRLTLPAGTGPYRLTDPGGAVVAFTP
jgi:hypothetical protein